MQFFVSNRRKRRCFDYSSAFSSLLAPRRTFRIVVMLHTREGLSLSLVLSVSYPSLRIAWRNRKWSRRKAVTTSPYRGCLMAVYSRTYFFVYQYFPQTCSKLCSNITIHLETLPTLGISIKSSFRSLGRFFWQTFCHNKPSKFLLRKSTKMDSKNESEVRNSTFLDAAQRARFFFFVLFFPLRLTRESLSVLTRYLFRWICRYCLREFVPYECSPGLDTGTFRRERAPTSRPNRRWRPTLSCIFFLALF